MPVSYKIFSKALCGRLLPYIATEVAFWQRAFLCKRDRQELVYTLKTSIDDFRHHCTRLYLVFIDFADAFGSVRHEFIFETLKEFGVPLMYCCIIENLYKNSSFEVICGHKMSKRFHIVRCTKTGDPLSALLFIMVIDRVCKPMVTAAVLERNIRDEIYLNPMPVQAFADDIVLAANNLSVIKSMIAAAESKMDEAGLQVKHEKCAVFFGRRSGNNWYKCKENATPEVEIKSNRLPVYQRDKPYKYLGKSMSIVGEDAKQITDVVDTYKDLVTKIKASDLPLALKGSAMNNLALAKILHHFYNSRLSVKQLDQLDNKITDAVRELFSLYKSTTRIVIFLPRENGGLGIKRISDVYRSTRLAFHIKMLNHDVMHFRHIALKGSAMNNLALAKILHHFYNSRLSVKQLDQLDNKITDAVRELFSLYKLDMKKEELGQRMEQIISWDMN